MIRGITVIILPSFIAQACAQDVSARTQDTPDDLVDTIVKNVADELFNRMLEALPVHQESLDNTVMGKPGHLAIPTSGMSRLTPVFAIPNPASGSSGRATSGNMRMPGGAETKTISSFPSRGAEQKIPKLQKVGSWKQQTKASASGTEVSPYTINYLVDGADKDDESNGVNMKYMERKMESALENSDNVASVNVRLNVEGTVPKIYRMEVTVKKSFGGTMVLSNPRNAESTFVEAVDHMHDTLKRNLRKDKEKRVAKMKQQRKDEGKMLDEDADPEA
jgi:ribosome-associated translation inhibitor RaiA